MTETTDGFVLAEKIWMRGSGEESSALVRSGLPEFQVADIVEGLPSAQFLEEARKVASQIGYFLIGRTNADCML